MGTKQKRSPGRGLLLRLLVSASCVLLALPLAAQRTWIVDGANGPGTDFLDIDVAYADH